MTSFLPRRAALGVVAAAISASDLGAQPVTDPLPSWRDGPRKRALLDFVAAVTREGGPDFVPQAARIATFDNDGCLWVEQPAYATEGPGRRFGMIIRHDDAEREYAYDRESHVGRLSRALDAAPQRGWHVVSMRDDWARIFAWSTSDGRG